MVYRSRRTGRFVRGRGIRRRGGSLFGSIGSIFKDVAPIAYGGLTGGPAGAAAAAGGVGLKHILGNGRRRRRRRRARGRGCGCRGGGILWRPRMTGGPYLM